MIQVIMNHIYRKSIQNIFSKLHKIWSTLKSHYYWEVVCLYFFSHLLRMLVVVTAFNFYFFPPPQKRILPITEMSFNVTGSSCTFELWQYIKRWNIASIKCVVIFHSKSWIVSSIKSDSLISTSATVEWDVYLSAEFLNSM